MFFDASNSFLFVIKIQDVSIILCWGRLFETSWWHHSVVILNNSSQDVSRSSLRNPISDVFLNTPARRPDKDVFIKTSLQRPRLLFYMTSLLKRLYDVILITFRVGCSKDVLNDLSNDVRFKTCLKTSYQWRLSQHITMTSQTNHVYDFFITSFWWPHF